MQFVLKFADDLWNIRWVKGHRTRIAQLGLMLAAGVLVYQGLATKPELLAVGVNLPDLSADVLLGAAGAAGYFAKKVKQFAQEHQPPTA